VHAVEARVTTACEGQEGGRTDARRREGGGDVGPMIVDGLRIMALHSHPRLPSLNHHLPFRPPSNSLYYLTMESSDFIVIIGAMILLPPLVFSWTSR
jgi:hypothetical protein